MPLMTSPASTATVISRRAAGSVPGQEAPRAWRGLESTAHRALAGVATPAGVASGRGRRARPVPPLTPVAAAATRVSAAAARPDAVAAPTADKAPNADDAADCVGAGAGGSLDGEGPVAGAFPALRLCCIMYVSMAGVTLGPGSC